MLKNACSFALLLISLHTASSRAETPPAADEVFIRGATLVDGSGAPGQVGNLLIRDDRIAALGPEVTPPATARLIDGSGLIVCPGFIDLHTHSDEPILREATRSNLNYQTQGVTTVVTGNCGGGALDVEAYFAKIDRDGAGTNVIHLIPHNQIRESVVGRGDHPPTAVQLVAMRKRVDREMRAGAWGMSTGLIYQPGVFAKTEELIELSKVVVAHHGVYASHIRDEGAGLLDSIDETLRIGKEAGLPVHISHLKVTGRANWGLTTAACERIEKARAAGQLVSADQYPYVASSTRLTAMVVPPWASQGTLDDFKKLLNDPVQGKRLRDEIASDLKGRDGGSSIRIARYAKNPAWVGKNLVEIARLERTDPLEIVLEIERNGSAQAISFGMSEDDVRAVMLRDFVATASDGASHRPGGGDRPHPRAYGTFPRKIRYALDHKLMTLEAAVRSCSGLPAQILSLPDRGILRAGAIADVLVFDPNTFKDLATFENPTLYASGVRYLFVNGTPVIDGGKPVKALPGRALRLTTEGPASTILKVGRIWTGDPARPWAEAVAIRDGAIAAVGSLADVEPFRGRSTAVINLPNTFASPGLIDSHVHLISLGESLEDVDLRGVKSLDEVARKVKARIDATPGDSWIVGSNWDQSLWPNGDFPTSAVLDAVAPHRPVWLRRVDGHAGWANSEALRRAKVTKATQPPPDGQILRDSQGEPTGVFIDGAMGLVSSSLPDSTSDQIARRILAAQAVSLMSGLTGVHDAGISAREVEVFRRLDREGKLKLRVYGMASPPAGGEVAFVKTSPLPHKPGRRFELRAIKLFADGAMGSRGGLLFEPYADDPKNVGLTLIDPKVLKATTAEALRHGWQVCTHAIGDKGNALVLDAYEAALKEVPNARDPRLRIEHAQVVQRSDVPRFAKLGVIASMQPSHSSDDMRWADARLGPERARGAYAWRWFIDDGVKLAFGSDFPVAVVPPTYGIYCALTRQDEAGNPPGGWHPDQKLTAEETLTAFTAGSAYAAFSENRLSVLKPGFRADLTILNVDPFRSEPRNLVSAKVVMTIVEGEVVYRGD